MAELYEDEIEIRNLSPKLHFQRILFLSVFLFPFQHFSGFYSFKNIENLPWYRMHEMVVYFYKFQFCSK